MRLLVEGEIIAVHRGFGLKASVFMLPIICAGYRVLHNGAARKTLTVIPTFVGMTALLVLCHAVRKIKVCNEFREAAR
jgi:hypothetical protein